MSLFICPICKGYLSFKENKYICKNNHTFDLSKEGYVNLLPVNKKNSKNPGDDKDMVLARTEFLNKGYYSNLQKALVDLSIKYTGQSAVVLDSGCGEGYYTNEISSHLKQTKKRIEMLAIDISKWAVRHASKNSNGVKFAVASAYSMPIDDKCVDLIINCFSPLSQEEFSRVLKKDGHFIYVVPAKKHLWELKKIMYETPYENDDEVRKYKNFKFIETISVQQIAHITSSEDLKNLFMMTPYAHKTSKTAIEKLDSIDKLDVNVEFDIHIYKKINKK